MPNHRGGHTTESAKFSNFLLTYYAFFSLFLSYIFAGPPRYQCGKATHEKHWHGFVLWIKRER